jgi:serine/threonine-protein kinase
VVGATPQPRRVDEAEARSQSTAPGAAGWFSSIGPLGLRRSALVAAPLAFLLIVAGGVGARAMLPEPVRATKPAPAKPVAQKPAVQPVAPAAGGGAAVIEEPARPQSKKQVLARTDKKPEKAAEKPAALRGNGRLELAVAPWGEVLVDGKNRGISPPLRVLEVPAGAHTVEIRNSTFPPHVASIEVKAGEAVRIQHRFR